MNTLWSGGAAYVDAAGAVAAVVSAVGTSKVATVNASDELVGVTDDALVETVVLDTAASGQAIGNVSGALGAISVSGGGGATAEDLASMRFGDIFLGGGFADGVFEGMTVLFQGTAGDDDDEQLGGYRERTFTVPTGTAAYGGAALNDSGTPYLSGEGFAWYPGMTFEFGVEHVSGDWDTAAGASTGWLAGANSGRRGSTLDNLRYSGVGVGYYPTRFGSDAGYVCFWASNTAGTVQTHRVQVSAADVDGGTTFKWRVRVKINTVDASNNVTSATIYLLDPSDDTTVIDEHTFSSGALPGDPASTTDYNGVHGFALGSTQAASTGSGNATMRFFDISGRANTDGSE